MKKGEDRWTTAFPRGRAALPTSCGAAPSLEAAHRGKRSPSPAASTPHYFILPCPGKVAARESHNSVHNHGQFVVLCPSMNLGPGDKASLSKEKVLERNSGEMQVNSSGRCMHLHQTDTERRVLHFLLSFHLRPVHHARHRRERATRSPP